MIVVSYEIVEAVVELSLKVQIETLSTAAFTTVAEAKIAIPSEDVSASVDGGFMVDVQPSLAPIVKAHGQQL